MFVFKLVSLIGDDVSELLDCPAVTLDECNGDIESGEVTSDTFDGAGGVSCFGESVADALAEILFGRKVDVVAPSDVMGVDEERLEFDLR